MPPARGILCFAPMTVPQGRRGEERGEEGHAIRKESGAEPLIIPEVRSAGGSGKGLGKDHVWRTFPRGDVPWKQQICRK